MFSLLDDTRSSLCLSFLILRALNIHSYWPLTPHHSCLFSIFEYCKKEKKEKKTRRDPGHLKKIFAEKKVSDFKRYYLKGCVYTSCITMIVPISMYKATILQTERHQSFFLFFLKGVLHLKK